MERMRRLWRWREEGQTIWWGDGWAYKMDAAAKEGSWKAEMETWTGAEEKPSRSPATHVNVTSHCTVRTKVSELPPSTGLPDGDEIQSNGPTCSANLTALNYWSNVTAVRLQRCATSTRSHLSTVKEADTITLFSMLLFFFFASHVLFYYKLKKRIQYNKKLQ